MFINHRSLNDDRNVPGTFPPPARLAQACSGF